VYKRQPGGRGREPAAVVPARRHHRPPPAEPHRGPAVQSRRSAQPRVRGAHAGRVGPRSRRWALLVFERRLPGARLRARAA